MTLPHSFLDRPIAHRGLHDKSDNRAENSLRSFQAAIDRGYGIELDLQLSKDGVAMVFHDYELSRLTGESGATAQRTAQELNDIALLNDGGRIPTLMQVLDLVDGRVPLLIEIKDQDGIMGPNVGPLEKATADALKSYKGDAAIMSFNPHSIAAIKSHNTGRPLGLVTAAYDADGWSTIPAARRDELRQIPDFDRVNACFISHEAADLDRERVAELKAAGHHILCWTIRSSAQEKEARRIVDNVTFEGYLA